MAATVERISLDQSQRDDALELANQVRCWHAQTKRDIRAGRTSVLAVIENNDPWLATIRVTALLTAQPGRGPVKAAKLLRGVGVVGSVRFGDLTPVQHAVLWEALS